MSPEVELAIPPHEVEAMQRRAVVEEALTWLGTPWHHAARAKGHGVDCGQFLIGVFANAGVIESFQVPHYPQDWALHRGSEVFLGIVERYARERVVGCPRPGDVLLFKYGRCLSHAALVVTYPRIIHAYLGAAGVVLDDVVANADLATRYIGAWSCWRA
jgi:cell wall-associated NlpC family hydrolase